MKKTRQLNSMCDLGLEPESENSAVRYIIEAIGEILNINDIL